MRSLIWRGSIWGGIQLEPDVGSRYCKEMKATADTIVERHVEKATVTVSSQTSVWRRNKTRICFERPERNYERSFLAKASTVLYPDCSHRYPPNLKKGLKC
jgi:hypothetical protein